VAWSDSPFDTFTELVATTYRNHKAEVADNVSAHNALYRRLTQKGRIRVEDGGLSIVTPLEYAENSTYQRYSGFDVLNVAASDVLTAAEYEWKQVATHVAASGLELRTNSGESRIVNFIKAKVKNAMNTMKNGLAEDFYSDGTASNQIGGLQKIVANAGTGTVGNIDSGTYTWWQNVVQDDDSLLGGGTMTVSATTIETFMLQTWLRLTRGTDVPDLVVLAEDYFTYFEQSQTALKRYAPSDDGKGGMIAMKYKTADVFHDGDGIIPDTTGYMLNTDYLEVVVHKDANLEMMDQQKAINQDAVVIPIIWMGNLSCSNRKLQGVMHG
jgi:hypothetical protein